MWVGQFKKGGLVKWNCRVHRHFDWRPSRPGDRCRARYRFGLCDGTRASRRSCGSRRANHVRDPAAGTRRPSNPTQEHSRARTPLLGSFVFTRYAAALGADFKASLYVIARNSSFANKGKSQDVRQVGKALGARYVLVGSLQEAAGG